MEKEELIELLYDRFIKPTENNEKDFVGIEVEMPIVNLSGEATDQNLTQHVFNEFIKEFGFDPIAYDENGICYSATKKENEDNLSFDCSYNNMEIALGKEEDIHALNDKFKEYISFLNNHLYEQNHLLSGFGVNPQYDINIPDYIPAERYRILGRFIEKAKDWADHQYQHNYNGYGTYASASQVQLDVDKDNIIDTIKAFAMVEPIKAVLFSNSVFKEEPNFLGTRDIFWENGPVGLNPHNVGFTDVSINDIPGLLEYLTTTSVFNVSRNGKYIHFKPIKMADYFNMDYVDGEYYEDGEFKNVKFKPEKDDIKFLRTYKYEDLTFRGTLEFRSCCNQPFSEAMTVAAFHLGLMKRVPELLDLMRNDTVLFNHGYSTAELRRMLVQKDWPNFIDKENLKELIKQVLDLAKEGLLERAKGEEVYLEPLYQRAEKLESPGRVFDNYLKENDSIVEIVKDYARLD